MRVLFISSGNKEEGISPIVFAQGESLRSFGITIDYFTIQGKGLKGYLKSIVQLRKKLNQDNFDIVHAHYSLSGFAATLACPKRLIVSLMGTDTYRSGIQRVAIKICYNYFWKTTIVKTLEMKNNLDLTNAVVLPNGVDMSVFKPINKESARKKLSIPLDKRILIFLSNPARKEKNFELANQSVKILNDPQAMLLTVFDIAHNDIPYYLNAADAILLTSLWEGSVNVVKEAMACNTPVISTNVGDVYHNTNGLAGFYISKSNPEEFAEGIKIALNNNKPINGRERIIALELDANSIALKLVKIYESLLKITH